MERNRLSGSGQGSKRVVGPEEGILFFDPGQESERNQRLRELVVSLSATLLRNISRNSLDNHNPTSGDTELLLGEAEECFRCARIPGVKKELANRFEAIGYAFMKNVVEIETVKQRAKWQK